MTAEPTTEPLFRIHWLNETTCKSGQFAGLYSESEAKVWVAALNRDPSNIKQGLTYWKVKA